MSDIATPDTAEPTAAPARVDICDVCVHPTPVHDRIAGRFCAATQAKALSRGCICRPG